VAHKLVPRRIRAQSGRTTPMGFFWHWKAVQGILKAMASPPKPVSEPGRRSSLEGKPKLLSGQAPDQTEFQRKQRRRMLVAAILLLTALGVVLVRDWNLWFGGDDAIVADIETTEAAEHEQSSNLSAPPRTAKAKKHSIAASPAAPQTESSPVITDRKALPPLDVEVVAAGRREELRPGSDAIKVEMQGGAEPISSPMLDGTQINEAPATNAAQRVKLSANTAQALQTPVDPSYPTLARQMKVQGAVVIQALIGADGDIQDLRILSGPSILASAAQEAVRQWRFKPYLQNGRPVETQAKITVNFTISTF
jgi:TonB family protein